MNTQTMFIVGLTLIGAAVGWAAGGQIPTGTIVGATVGGGASLLICVLVRVLS